MAGRELQGVHTGKQKPRPPGAALEPDSGEKQRPGNPGGTGHVVIKAAERDHRPAEHKQKGRRPGRKPTLTKSAPEPVDPDRSPG